MGSAIQKQNSKKRQEVQQTKKYKSQTKQKTKEKQNKNEESKIVENKVVSEEKEKGKQKNVDEYKQKKQKQKSKEQKQIQKQNNLSKKIKNLEALIKQIKIRYKDYYKSSHQQQNEKKDLHKLFYVTRNIFMNMIKEKLTNLNSHKITFDQCKVQISKFILQVELRILKYIQKKCPNQARQFMQVNDVFLRTLMTFLKSVYPRNQTIQAGELAKRFIQMDNTQLFDYDILKNAGIVFNTYQDPNEITNSIKTFINKIIDELNIQFQNFEKFMKEIHKGFKVGRKLGVTTPKYFAFNTGTVDIKSTQIQRVLIKWRQQLFSTIKDCQSKINNQNQYKLYKKQNDHKVQFTKCQSQLFQKFKNEGLIRHMKSQRQYLQGKQQRREKQFRQFNLMLLQILNQMSHNQHQISNEEIEIIKFSSDNNSFLQWLVVEQIIQAIKGILTVTKQIQQYRGVLDIIKFKVTDLLRCQIQVQKKQLIRIYDQLKNNKKIQIVKVKNRFKTAMCDVMINFKFKNSFIICQCQLILAEDTQSGHNKTAKNVQYLNHFIYELERSPHGVLGEISVFLSKKSNVVAKYSKKLEIQINNSKKAQTCLNSCGKKQQKQAQQASKKQKASKKLLEQEENQKENKEDKKKTVQTHPIICSKCTFFFQKYQNQQIHQCSKCHIALCFKCKKSILKKQKDSLKTNKYQLSNLQKVKNFIEDKSKIFKENHQQMLVSAEAFLKQLHYQTLEAGEVFQKMFNPLNIFQNAYIKQAAKDKKKIKARELMKFINQTDKFEQKYLLTELNFNFIIIKCLGEFIRFKSYRYDYKNEIIINSFQHLQKYQQYDDFQLNQQHDLVYCIKPNQEGLTIINYDDFKVEENILQNTLYLFEGQNKQKMLQDFAQLSNYEKNKKQIKQQKSKKITHHYKRQQVELEKLKEIAKKHKSGKQKEQLKKKLQDIKHHNKLQLERELNQLQIKEQQKINVQKKHQYYMMAYNIKLIQNKIYGRKFAPMHFIIDIVNSYKKSKSDQKINLYLQQKKEQNKYKKEFDLRNMSINTKQIHKLNINQYVLSIKSLNLSDNTISNINTILENCLQIQKLNVSFNQIQSLNFSHELVHLIELDASENLIQKINNLFKIQNAKILKLNDNYLAQLPVLNFKLAAQQKLKSLVELNLSSNLFSDMSSFAYSEEYFPELANLNLQNNRIQALSQIYLPNLEDLNLQHNLIENILPGFDQSNCYNLYSLNLKDNFLQHMPKLKFENLRIVDLSYNKLKDIDDFSQGPSFFKLNIFFISLTQPQKLPKLNAGIKVFGFQNSSLTNDQVLMLIQKNKFQKLNKLYLAKNQIQYLPSIQSLKELQCLYLEQNPIENVDQLQKQQQKPPQNNKNSSKNKQKQVFMNYGKLGSLWLSVKDELKLQMLKQIIFENKVPKSTIDDNKAQKNQKQLKKGKQERKVMQYKEILSKKIVCWKHHSTSLQNTFYENIDELNRNPNCFGVQMSGNSHHLMSKRQYFTKTFGNNQIIINKKYNRFIEEGSPLQNKNQRHEYQLSKNLIIYFLDHQLIKINMNEFIKCNWNQLTLLNLRKCGLNDKNFKIFLDNHSIYPNLKWLFLSGNKIETIPKGSLEKFKHLVEVQFYLDYCQYQLSNQSYQYLKKHQKLSSVRVKYRSQRQPQDFASKIYSSIKSKIE